jgi:hypothetical protein
MAHILVSRDTVTELLFQLEMNPEARRAEGSIFMGRDGEIYSYLYQEINHFNCRLGKWEKM